MTTDPIDLPPPAFRLIWRDGQYRVSAPNIGDTDCYTAELARTHADNCIRALKAERDAALARAEKAEARAGSVPAGFVLVPLEPTDNMLVFGQEAWVKSRKARNAVEDCTEAADVYRSMLAVAPSAPSTPPDAMERERKLFETDWTVWKDKPDIRKEDAWQGWWLAAVAAVRRTPPDEATSRDAERLDWLEQTRQGIATSWDWQKANAFLGFFVDDNKEYPSIRDAIDAAVKESAK